MWNKIYSTIHPGDTVTSGNFSWIKLRNLVNKRKVLHVTAISSITGKCSCQSLLTHYIIMSRISSDYNVSVLVLFEHIPTVPNWFWTQNYLQKYSNNAAASPGSINGRHKARGVGTKEDVCIDPHRPVNASTLVLLIKNIQRQTHRVQRFKIQLYGCREIQNKHLCFSRVHVKRHTHFSRLGRKTLSV